MQALTIPLHGVDPAATLTPLGMLPRDPTVALEPGRVVQQRITCVDAAAQWRRLVTALGAPAPGPSGLLTPPDPRAVARLDYADMHRLGLERTRATTLVLAARAALRLQGVADAGAVLPALRAVRGVGPWTTSCLAVFTWGDRDAVIVGDDGIPSLVAWVVAREHRADDARLLELLEPYRPHRYRVIRLAFASGLRPPRRRSRAQRHDIRRR